MNDVNRLRILQDVIDRRLTTRLAANRLEISDRHCRRLLERYREHGPLRRRGQPGNRQLIPGLAQRALRIIRLRGFSTPEAANALAEVFMADYIESLQLPCRQCVNCRLTHSREWAIRCTHEAKMWVQNCFITLTSDDEQLHYVQ